jgi:hypothetical protein
MMLPFMGRLPVNSQIRAIKVLSQLKGTVKIALKAVVASLNVGALGLEVTSLIQPPERARPRAQQCPHILRPTEFANPLANRILLRPTARSAVGGLMGWVYEDKA